jgi:hypothetical protein
MDRITPHRMNEQHPNERNKAYIGNCEGENKGPRRNDARHGIREAFQNPQQYLILRLDPDEQQPHPCPDDRLLERPIIRRAPTHPARRRRSRTAATLVPLLLLLASLVFRSSCSERGHRARVAVPREQEQRRMRWERRM